MFMGPCIVNQLSIIVQRDATIYIFIIFMQTALHVSGDTPTHHQEHTQTVTTAFGTGRTVFAIVLWRGGVPTPPRQRTVAKTVRPVPDIVTTVCVCSCWWMRVSSEICRAILQKYNQTVYSRILLDNYWQWFTMHGPMNIKLIYLLLTCFINSPMTSRKAKCGD